MRTLSRRKFLLGGSLAAAGSAAAQCLLADARGPAPAAAAGYEHGSAHHLVTTGTGHLGMVGRVNPAVNGFDPTKIVRDFDWGTARRTAAGRTVREWELITEDKEIEIAPGIKYAAYTYNGRVPGPTLRAREGDLLRIRFVNKGAHPHTIHFHGIHTAGNDGVPGIGQGNVGVDGETTYEFDATPFGLHFYHCHSSPLADHITKGLYGAFIIDPKQGRPEADELVLVQNGFDTNFDRSNEIYAVNTVAFAYLNDPIKVKRGELVRIYLVNALEFDLVNSFHIHGNFFNLFPIGTKLEPTEYTDTVVQGQGRRDVLELRFPHTGQYMFHAHVSEFAELGWMGFFEVV